MEDYFNALPDPSEYFTPSGSANYTSYSGGPEGRDELFEQTVRMISQHDRASASLIQRRLQVGFNRACRLLEQLEEAGVVGAADGSKPRDVLVRNADEFLEKLKKE